MTGASQQTGFQWKQEKRGKFPVPRLKVRGVARCGTEVPEGTGKALE